MGGANDEIYGTCDGFANEMRREGPASKSWTLPVPIGVSGLDAGLGDSQIATESAGALDRSLTASRRDLLALDSVLERGFYAQYNTARKPNSSLLDLDRKALATCDALLLDLHGVADESSSGADREGQIILQLSTAQYTILIGMAIVPLLSPLWLPRARSGPR